MNIDPIPAPSRHLVDDAGHPAVANVGGSPASGADDVVVVRGLARHESVLTARQIEPLDEPELRQDLERPEHGGATHAEPSSAGRGHEVVGREVPSLLRDELGESPAWLGQPVAGLIERADDRFLLGHACTISLSRLSRNTARPQPDAAAQT